MGTKTAEPESKAGVAFHDYRLFLASCIALIATAIVFSVRGDILGDLKAHFGLNNAQVGLVSAFALWGFTIAILIGGQLCDLLGMKAILGLAFLFHVLGTVLTIYAPGYAALIAATLIIGLGNGFVEAGVNPLVATIYPDRKTQKLNALHAWWPGGLVLGALASFLLTQIGQTWQTKMWLILIPTAVYGFLFLKLKLPQTERVQSGVSTKQMYRELFRPLFLIFLFCMLLTAATELGTNQWIGEIMKNTAFQHTAKGAGILILAWISAIMLIGRLFAAPVVDRIAPTGLLILSAAISCVGLLLLGAAKSAPAAFRASFVFALGVCYFWPTMLGVTSERFPKGGAFLLGLMGAAGMASAGASMGWLGKLYDKFGPSGALQYMAVLPVVLVVIFGAIYLRDRSRGGYKIEKL